jgi:hypothetical protein
MRLYEREGEVNHDVAMMRVNAEYPLRKVNRENIACRSNGPTSARIIYTGVIVRKETSDDTD